MGSITKGTLVAMAMAREALFVATLALLAVNVLCAGPSLTQPNAKKDVPQIKPSEYAKMMAKARPVTTATKTELATKTKATKTELAPGPAWNFKEARNWEKVWYTLQGVKPKGFPKVTNPPTLGMCNGTHQSPIDVKNTKKFDHINVENKLKLAWYNASGFEWKSDGKELWLEGKGFEGSTTAFDGATYKLKRARFVSPGEHAFDGKQPPMEVQFEHEDADRPDGTRGPLKLVVRFDWSSDNKLVIDDEGEEQHEETGNPILAKDLDWFGVMKKLKGNGPAGEEKIKGRCCQKCPWYKKKTPEVIGCGFFQPLELVPSPSKQKYFWYYGSETTPPCKENVLWVLLDHHMYMTYDQWKAFSFKGKFRPMMQNKNPVKFMHSKKKAAKGGGMNKHAFVEDCGLWGLNCAKDEYYST